MRTFFRYLLEQRELRDHAAFLPRFKQAARELADYEGNPSLGSLEPGKTTFEEWLYGKRRPQRDARRVLVHMFGYSLDQLWSGIPDGTVPDLVPLFSTPLTAPRAENTGMGLHEMRSMGAMAARRAKDFALGVEREQLGEATLGYLSDEVKRLTEAYPRVPLSTIWEDLATAQDDAFRLLESGRARPQQLRDLYFMATVLSFLMAKGSHDIGESATALNLARTAEFCAEQTQHRGLLALVQGLKSLISYWADRPEDALHFARLGAAQCAGQRGTVTVWLPGLEARAAALLGDEETVRLANQRAATLRERVEPDDLDALGGLLTYPEIKQDYYTVESEVLLHNGDAQVTALAEQTVRGFSDRDDPAWAFGDMAGSQCNLALVRLYAGELDGAAEALRPVLDLPPNHRNNGIVVSARRVREALVREPVRETSIARELRAEITQYESPRPSLRR